MDRPWWAQASALQIIIATVILAAGLGVAWGLSGSLSTMSGVLTEGYMALAGLWLTRRVARCLGFALEESGSDPHGPSIAAAVGEGMVVPLYSVMVVLLCAIAINVTARAADMPFVDAWYTTFIVIIAAVLATITATITILAIWHRIGRAGGIAATVAQCVGGATLYSVVAIGWRVMQRDAQVDKWYNIPADPVVTWPVFLVLCCLFGVLAIFRLWQQIKGERLMPWATALALIVLVGFLAGLDRLTGFWPSSWLYGAFFILRFTSYGLFLFRSHEAPVWRSGWFVCFVAMLIMCGVTTIFVMTGGSFAMMMQPMIMQPFPPIGMEGKIFTFGLTLGLCTARDLLFLVWINRIRPNGWGDAIGFGILIALYWPVALLIEYSGWTFLNVVFYPLFVSEMMDLVWPVAMIGILVVLIVRAHRRDLVENPSWA